MIRNLFIFGVAGLGLWSAAAAGLWSGKILTPAIHGVVIRFQLTGMFLSVGAACTAMGFWMIWTSKVGKVREREALLDRITWSGTERVLDAGCGRGLMLIGAAKRLTTGKATGIDIWQGEDRLYMALRG